MSDYIPVDILARAQRDGWEAKNNTINLAAALYPAITKEEKVHDEEEWLVVENKSFDTNTYSHLAPVPFKKDWFLPVEDQGDTQCCLSFAICTVLRARFRRENKLSPNISPMHLHQCNFSLSVNMPPLFGNAVNSILNLGVPIYNGIIQLNLDNFCGTYLPSGVQKIKNLRKLANIEQVKEELRNVGPVLAHIAVEKDFFSYIGKGIYRATGIPPLFPHAVCLIDYDDVNKCWVAVNSFGSGWGDEGFFRIEHKNSGILSYVDYPVCAIDPM